MFWNFSACYSFEAHLSNFEVFIILLFRGIFRGGAQCDGSRSHFGVGFWGWGENTWGSFLFFIFFIYLLLKRIDTVKMGLLHLILRGRGRLKIWIAPLTLRLEVVGIVGAKPQRQGSLRVYVCLVRIGFFFVWVSRFCFEDSVFGFQALLLDSWVFLCT